MNETDQHVTSAVLAVARRHHPDLTAVTAEQQLDRDLGFDSLDLAQVVAQLEIDLGIDPFATQPLSGIRSVGDLCAAYRR